MSENKRYKDTLDELIRYRNNKMTNSERNEFERALEQDPFLSEALEGISSFKSSDIEKDLVAIDLVSGKKKRKIAPVFYLSVAASIAVLVLISIFYDRDESVQLVENEMVQEDVIETIPNTVDEMVNDSISSDADSAVVLVAELQGLPKKEKPRQVKKISSKVDAVPQKVEIKEESITATARVEFRDIEQVNTSLIVDGAADLPENDVQNERMMVSKQMPQKVEAEPVSTKEKLVKRKGANSKAVPFGGNSLYKVYLDENIRYPQSEERPSREVVRVSFVISTKGNPENITVTKSPDNQDFAKEVIRLIKNGPKWSPEIKDGIPVKSEESLRIVFKAPKD